MNTQPRSEGKQGLSVGRREKEKAEDRALLVYSFPDLHPSQASGGHILRCERRGACLWLSGCGGSFACSRRLLFG